MPVLINIILFFSILTITSIPALAVNEGRNQPSEIFVWVFLGCCALIIVAQIAPLLRNIRKQTKIAAEQTKELKQQ